MEQVTLQNEINKRFSLNWLIQGAAQHAGMTLHHAVRNELDAIDPGLVPLYDEFALVNLLQYWALEAALLFGWPPRFWGKAQSNPRHPFFQHAVLARHGGMLAAEARQRGLQRCREKAFWGLRFCFSLRAAYVMGRLRIKEFGHAQALAQIAKRAVAQSWGIPLDRLDAKLTSDVAFGILRSPRTFGGFVFRAGAVGYGGVLQRGKSLSVVGRGANWQLLTKELVKGTAELICLHGLNGLSDDDYRQVLDAADGVDFEPWMLHTGGELWRRFLAVVPRGRPIPEVLMHVARLPAKSVEPLMLAILEQPEWAGELLMGLGTSDEKFVSENGTDRCA